MRHKRNLVSIAIAAVFLLAGNATTVLAADATQSSSHQHQNGHDPGELGSAGDQFMVFRVAFYFVDQVLLHRCFPGTRVDGAVSAKESGSRFSGHSRTSRHHGLFARIG